MKYRILVLAMSAMGASYQTKGNYYAFFDAEGKRSDDLFYGVGQLEPVPQYICKTCEPITHYIVLQTMETLKPLDHDWNRINQQIRAEESIQGADGAVIDYVDGEAISAVSFFEKRIRSLYRKNGYDVEPEFIPVALDENDVQGGVTELLRVVRELYQEFQEKTEPADWKLWIDIHGGFRDAALAIFALLQTLSAPDEQDLISGKNARMDAFLAHLTDGKSTIPIEKVYTVNFTPDKKGSKANPQPILDKTEFYQLFTRESLNAYMNYGQYAQLALQSVIDLKQKDIPPYAFISYRRMDAPKERAAFLGVLKKEGYRYWYDDSIPLDKDWRKELQKAITKSSVFIALISQNYFSSFQCVKELQQAIKENKAILFVSLDPTNLYSPKGDIILTNKDIVLTDEDEKVTVKVTKAEIDEIVAKNQLLLKGLLDNGVFQVPNLIQKLKELSKDEDSVYYAIREHKDDKEGGKA